jgi:hypothetical protein
MLEKLEKYERAIKLVFRLVVVALLLLIAWRVEEAIDIAEGAYSYAETAAQESEQARIAATEAREAADRTRYH